jgi:hypothetical protein
MENEHSSEFGTQPPKEETKADKEWSEFERDLETLGRQLASLQEHTGALGVQLVSTLEASFEEMKNRAESFSQARARELDQVREAAWQQAREAESTLSDVRQRSTETARQMWERSEPLRQGAADVGVGLSRAWAELRASFGKAADRLNAETPPNGATPATGEEGPKPT